MNEHFFSFQCWCIIGSPFQNVVHILKWHQSAGMKPPSHKSPLSTRGSNPSQDEEQSDRSAPPSRAGSVLRQAEITVLSK